MRRGLLALGIGLGIAGALYGIGMIRVPLSVPNGEGNTSFAAAHPSFLLFNIPGIALLWFVFYFVHATWASNDIAMQALVTAGNAMFCALAAYAVLRILETRRQP